MLLPVVIFEVVFSVIGIKTFFYFVFRTTDTTYNLVLTAKDEGTPAKSAELTIRVKVAAVAATPPSFRDRQFKGSVKDNTPSGEKITEVSVQAPQENMAIQYQIIAGNKDNSFCIDYRKFAYTQKPVDFDKWKKAKFEVTVALTYDNSMSAAEVWAVFPAENDNAPVFVGGSQPVIKVLPEDAGEFFFNSFLY